MTAAFTSGGAAVVRVVFLLAGLVLGGCASEHAADCHGEYHAHRTLTPEVRVQVATAFAKWNALAGRDVARLVDGDREDETCAVRIDEELDVLGLWSEADGSIALAPGRMRTLAPGCDAQLDTCIEAVALHETGHALGLPHTPGAGHVMSPAGELLLDFTPADVEECAGAGVCGQ